MRIEDINASIHTVSIAPGSPGVKEDEDLHRLLVAQLKVLMTLQAKSLGMVSMPRQEVDEGPT